MTSNKLSDMEMFNLIRAAYCSGMIDAIEAIKSGITPDELVQLLAQKAEAYAANVTQGTL
jgi:hypothetical protein